MAKPKVLGWVELVLALLGIFEKILPAALVSYNANLKMKLGGAKALAEIAEAERKASEKSLAVLEETKGLGRRALLDRALSRKGPKPPPK